MDTSYQETPGIFSRIFGSIKTILVIAVVIIIGLFIYKMYQGRSGIMLPPKDQTPAPVDGKEETTIKESELPSGDITDYGVQFWMYVKDWSHNFGKRKNIVRRN